MTCEINTTFCKGINEVLDYLVKWDIWLAGDTVATSTFTADTGLTVDSDTNTADTATVWLSGGSKGSTYKVKNSITTAAGRTAVRSFYVKMIER